MIEEEVYLSQKAGCRYVVTLLTYGATTYTIMAEAVPQLKVDEECPPGVRRHKPPCRH